MQAELIRNNELDSKEIGSSRITQDRNSISSSFTHSYATLHDELIEFCQFTTKNMTGQEQICMDICEKVRSLVRSLSFDLEVAAP